MVCAEIQCTNHAKPSLCSGTDLKVKPMLYVLAFIEIEVIRILSPLLGGIV
jgi:hypothetical protein